jgi:transcriptional regulator
MIYTALLSIGKSVIIAIMPTQRQDIMDFLSKGTYTLQELSVELHMSIKELLLHLPHVQKSIRPPNSFVIDPAECLNCGYVFKDRTKLHSPGKCPRCRETHIKEPAYHIE